MLHVNYNSVKKNLKILIDSVIRLWKTVIPYLNKILENEDDVLYIHLEKNVNILLLLQYNARKAPRLVQCFSKCSSGAECIRILCGT